MEKSKVIKRLNNLKKVQTIIEIAKIDTIKKIADSNNIKLLHYEMAYTSQKIINYSKNLNKWNNKKFFKKNKPANNKTLWIYITISSNLIRISYSKYEKILQKNIDVKNDAIIAIGKLAVDFVKEHKYNIFQSFDKMDGAYFKISSLIMHAIKNKNFKNICILSNVKTKDKKDFYKIYPFEDIEYDYVKMKKMHFFYSLSDTLEQISFNYIKNIVCGIYQESYKNFYAEKLVRHEASLKNIDEKIVELKMFLIKNDKKEETEEMVQVIQSVKRT